MPGHATTWIETAGGPFVMIPRSKVSSWQGIGSLDYDDACNVNDYANIVERDWGHVLVLNDEPLRTTVISRSDGLAIVRWMYAPSASALLQEAFDFRSEQHQASERLRIKLLKEPYIMFDSARRGSEPGGVDVELPSGAKEVVTYVMRGEKIGFILHQFK